MTPWHIALAGGATATCRPRSPGARFFVCVFLEMRTLGEVVAASARRTSTAHRSRNVNRPISHDPPGFSSAWHERGTAAALRRAALRWGPSF